MDNFKHECIIGILYKNQYAFFASFEGLKRVVKEDKAFDKIMMLDPLYAEYYIGTKYKMSDYLDKRKSTNLHRFDYCPQCGKKIDWKKMREEVREDNARSKEN